MKKNTKPLSDYELFKYYEKLYKANKLQYNGTAYHRMLHFFDRYEQTRSINNAT